MNEHAQYIGRCKVPNNTRTQTRRASGRANQIGILFCVASWIRIILTVKGICTNISGISKVFLKSNYFRICVIRVPLTVPIPFCPQPIYVPSQAASPWPLFGRPAPSQVPRQAASSSQEPSTGDPPLPPSPSAGAPPHIGAWTKSLQQRHCRHYGPRN